ncbi:MAG: hypothetical protein LWW94_07090 [Candidatus Desulfofervidaceae bacterium]|nr:hypothetical protein [Candidatus Desulfofervidaceae bacterium]
MEVFPLRASLFRINGWLVDLRVATTVFPPAEKRYYQFKGLRPSSEVNFYVFACKEACYIVPAGVLNGKREIYIPIKRKNEYSLYRERWELLNEKMSS